MATMTVSLPDQLKDWVDERVKNGRYPTECVAKLSLRLRLNRDSVGFDSDSRGAVDDGAARARTRAVLLRV
jgi:Arc/MetJ-type ribon-helix-helix transcriptional regulator